MFSRLIDMINILLHRRLTCSLVGGHWGCFPFGAIINYAAVNICVRVPLWSYVLISLGYIPRSGIAWWCSHSVCDFEDLPDFSKAAAPIPDWPEIPRCLCSGPLAVCVGSPPAMYEGSVSPHVGNTCRCCFHSSPPSGGKWSSFVVRLAFPGWLKVLSVLSCGGR